MKFCPHLCRTCPDDPAVGTVCNVRVKLTSSSVSWIRARLMTLTYIHIHVEVRCTRFVRYPHLVRSSSLLTVDYEPQQLLLRWGTRAQDENVAKILQGSSRAAIAPLSPVQRPKCLRFTVT
ncbi:hypothetical protein AcW1_001119 [Taiwanofungus camphoratus]|nr:hypothetical protein AcV5_005034 [Antrodia cinnamomea]KAI0964258.1 hypothetical protein AcW1_001119 [Antrodia cinnamomea]